ncbi:MAG TPA: hypothetical protein VFA50_17620 [Stellaceae bacterium]|nr:hypothetical protein [Stellaceae bacterium]
MIGAFSRRVFMRGTAGVVFSAADALPPLVAAAPRGSAMVVTVVTAGQSFVFREDESTDLGDFTSPWFAQRCLRSTRPDIPLTIFFRPDRETERREVVFELGRCWDSKPVSIGPYEARIEAGGRALAKVVVTRHPWMARWRWQSSPRPVLRSPEEVFEKRWLPRFDGKLAYRARLSKPEIYEIMGNAGLTTYMPTTGQTHEMGIVTEPQGEFLCTTSTSSLQSLLAQAEASGSVTWHARDEKTNAPVDFNKYPQGGWTEKHQYNHPYIPITPPDFNNKRDWVIDEAHQPSLSYVAFVLTGDPYFLEELQFAANWNIGAYNPEYREGSGGVLSVAQSRGYAWALRTLGQCTRATPATVPAWFLPKSYFEGKLDYNRRWFERIHVDSTDKGMQVFRTFLRVGHTDSPFGEDLVLLVIGMLIIMGFAEWRRSFEWKVKNLLDRMGGKSGWPRAFATPYEYRLLRQDGRPAESWAEAFELSKVAKGWTDTLDREKWNGKGPAYLDVARAALAISVVLGTPGAKESWNWADASLKSSGVPAAYNWALSPDTV